jgi:hypothetical protein
MLIASVLVVVSWGYLIYTGSISTIWPLFGVGNQLLATIALAVTTTFLINNGKQRYAWTTAIPMVFVGVTTLVCRGAFHYNDLLAAGAHAGFGVAGLSGCRADEPLCAGSDSCGLCRHAPLLGHSAWSAAPGGCLWRREAGRDNREDRMLLNQGHSCSQMRTIRSPLS